MIAGLAAHTTSLTLGTLVIDNDFRHPAVLAKEIATLDLVTGGRIEIGLGAGWMTVDYDVSGIVYESAGVRISKLGETLQILDDVLRGGPTDFSGAHYMVASLLSIPPPTTKPRPRLLVGGGGDRVLRLAARHADVVSVNWTVGIASSARRKRSSTASSNCARRWFQLHLRLRHGVRGLRPRRGRTRRTLTGTVGPSTPVQPSSVKVDEVAVFVTQTDCLSGAVARQTK